MTHPDNAQTEADFTWPSIEVHSIGGNCPVQAEGEIDGKEFYFRARGGHWSIGIGGDPVTNPDWYFEAPYLDKEPETHPVVGEMHFSAGWMPESAALSFIHTAAVLYANTRVTTPATPEATDEREAFEAWAAGKYKLDKCTSEESPRCNCGKYIHDPVQAMWHAWQARAQQPAMNDMGKHQCRTGANKSDSSCSASEHRPVEVGSTPAYPANNTEQWQRHAKLITAVHAIIGYVSDLAGGMLLTNEYVERMKDHYIPQLIAALPTAPKEGE